ncbi:hypothetical protein KI387_008588 [Taxus chinensis]|uniref:non-specific serine/threonine protein kinase n=1 Tax=Taxus chinensis TaxID=29808 RepID=A0AA38CW95_TAXCH|nr:hypothetical protein KI387_008588 [Taxus chinensis]
MGRLANSLLALLIIFSISVLAQAESVNFTFPPRKGLHTTNDADIRWDDRIELTKNESSGNLSNAYGWAAYDNPVPLWDTSSRALATFSTHFGFVIGQRNDSGNGYGDGLAFFLAPFDLEQPLQAVGGGFGLFNSTTFGGSFYQMVAVEFDTFKNDWDPDDNHVGIDVNSTSSKKVVSLSNETAGSRPSDRDLKNGEYWDAWVEYNGGPRQLQVFLLYNPSGNINNISKPQKPILSYDIDLREFLPESITVGLSASTGFSAETHTVHVWNFSCEYSWATSAHPNNGSDEGNHSSGIPAKNEKSSTSLKVILIPVFAGVLAVCCSILVGRWLYLRKIKRRGEGSHESDAELDEWFAQGPRRFSYAELSAATKNFSLDEKLGQGGFGGVYRGIFRGTAETVAVKKISQGSKQGKKEYISEVTVISKLRHRNLVQLLGWCHEKGELLLVYEYLPNGSLDKYLFEEQTTKLDWDRRYGIAFDIASALLYLHEEWDQRVVHRDVKASNIMLDADFNGKLGDFGLARLRAWSHGAGAP